MIHVGIHSVGTYHKKFGRQNQKNKNILCRVSREDTRQRVLCRVPTIWHSAKKTLCRVPTLGSRQRLTAVSFGTAADGPLPSAHFAECFTLGKSVFAEWCPVPSVQHSVKWLVAESLTLPSAALGKAFFAECPTKGTRQRGRHSAKPQIPVVYSRCTSMNRTGKIKKEESEVIGNRSWSRLSPSCQPSLPPSVPVPGIVRRPRRTWFQLPPSSYIKRVFVTPFPRGTGQHPPLIVFPLARCFVR
jgi:hypothetical protein